MSGPERLRGRRRVSCGSRHGRSLRANDDGTFTTVAGGLNRPSSLEIIGNTAYVVTLGGEVWTIDDIAGPPYG